MRAEASYVLLRTKNICTPLSGVCCASTTLNMHMCMHMCMCMCMTCTSIYYLTCDKIR
jgi:hypothetical protein